MKQINSSPRSTSEMLEADAKFSAHLGRIHERNERIDALRALISIEDKGKVITALRNQGYRFEDGFEKKDLKGIREGIEAAIAEMEGYNNEVPGLEAAVRAQLVKVSVAGAADARESQAADTELSPEADLVACFERLRTDFERGIVLIDDAMKTDDYKAALKKDKTARKTWEEVKVQLEQDEGALLRKAASMPGGAELIGIDSDGRLVMVTRADKNGVREPVIFAQRGDEKLVIAGNTPDRDNTMKNIVDGDRRFADYWEIRDAVLGMGFELPRDPEEYVKKGLVAAVEAVTETDFVRSKNGEEWRSAITDCGDVNQSSFVRVVDFSPDNQGTGVYDDNPDDRDGVRGAVLVLRG